MLLAIDVGNTNTVFAVYEGDEIVADFRFSTDKNRTADEYAVLLCHSLLLKGLVLSVVSDVIIASVVPNITFPLTQLCTQHFHCVPMIVGTDAVQLGIAVCIDRPEEAGADRLVNAIAAHDKVKGAAIVIDFGTATTFDVINSQGDYVGGVICPGVRLSVEALHKAAAKLPEVTIAKPEQVIGKTTIGAMQSGIYWGYISMIEGITARLCNEMEVNPTLIATGGLASIFTQETNLAIQCEPDLTINGLKLIFDRNKRLLQ